MKFAIARNVVLRQLAWEMFVVGAHAATSDERMAILRTMVGLVESEARRSSTRTNDGNSARALLPRLIGATHEVRTPYIEEGFRLGEELLGSLESKTPPSEILCEAVLGVLLSVRVEDSWADGRTSTSASLWFGPNRLAVNGSSPHANGSGRSRRILAVRASPDESRCRSCRSTIRP